VSPAKETEALAVAKKEGDRRCSGGSPVKKKSIVGVGGTIVSLVVEEQPTKARGFSAVSTGVERKRPPKPSLPKNTKDNIDQKKGER